MVISCLYIECISNLRLIIDYGLLIAVGSGLPSKDVNGLSDPYLVIKLGTTIR